MISVEKRSKKEKKPSKSSSKSRPTPKTRQVSIFLPFLKKCNHFFEGNNQSDLKGSACFLCKITNSYIQNEFYKFEDQKKQDLLLSFNVKKKKKKVFLLFLWSHCQNMNYLINNLQNYLYYDLILSSELILNCSRLLHFNSLTNNKNLDTTSVKKFNILDFNIYFKKIYYLRKLAIFGNFAAIFIQSHIRKFLAKLKVRRFILTRFEYINELTTFENYRDFYIKKSFVPIADNSNYNTVNTKQYVDPTVSLVDYNSSKLNETNNFFFFYDTHTNKRWERYPLVLKNEPLGTPRTINRRLLYEESVGESKLKFFNEKILKEFNENLDTQSYKTNIQNNKKKKIPSKDIFFLQRELESINYIKNLAILHDILNVTMLNMKEKVDSKINDQNKLRLTFSAPSPCTRNIGLKIAMYKNQNILTYEENRIINQDSTSELKSNSKNNLTSRSNEYTNPIASIALSNPGTPLTTSRSRVSSGNIIIKPKIKNTSDNPGLDLLKNTFKKNLDVNSRPISGTNSSNLNSNSNDNIIKNMKLQNSLQKLEELIYESLTCKNVNELLENILNPELSQTYSLVNNLFEDDTDIWNNSRIYPLQPASFNSNITEEQQNIGIVPFYFSLKNVSSDFKPNGLFRLFFLDEELICVSSISPYCYYPEVYKNKDIIISSINKFVLLPEIAQMVQDYYYNARLKFQPAMIQQVANNSSYAPLQPRMNMFHSPNSLFLPSPKDIYPSNLPSFFERFLSFSTITDDQIKLFKDSYKFISKLYQFKERLKMMKKNALLKYRKQKKSLENNQNEDYNKEFSHLFPDSTNQSNPYVENSPLLNIKNFDNSKSNLNINLPFDSLLRPDIKPNKQPNKKLVKSFLHTKSTIPTLDIPSHSNSPSFFGEVIYDLLYDTKIELLENRKDVQSKQLHPYVESLLLNSTNVSSSFENRILYSADHLQEFIMPDLFVMDVHVNIPRGKMHKRSQFDSPENLSPSTSIPQYKVEVHEILGLFQSSISKCPSNLDCGLFSFSHFQSYKNNCSKKEKEIKKFSKLDESEEYLDFNFSEKEEFIKCSWSAPDANSGMSIGKTLTTSKKKFEFRVVGASPSMDYLESKLSKDVKMWLGLIK